MDSELRLGRPEDGHEIELDLTPEFVGSTIRVDGENVGRVIELELQAGIGDSPHMVMRVRRGDESLDGAWSVVYYGGAAHVKIGGAVITTSVVLPIYTIRQIISWEWRHGMRIRLHRLWKRVRERWHGKQQKQQV